MQEWETTGRQIKKYNDTTNTRMVRWQIVMQTGMNSRNVFLKEAKNRVADISKELNVENYQTFFSEELEFIRCQLYPSGLQIKMNPNCVPLWHLYQSTTGLKIFRDNQLNYK